MKCFYVIPLTCSLASAFVPSSSLSTAKSAEIASASPLTVLASRQQSSDYSSRAGFLKSLSIASLGVTGSFLLGEPAIARGRATLEQSYERYYPRIKTGGEFYNTELRKLVQSSDWAGIKDALADPPKRKKEDLRKPDAGVAERARQAGGFSDARVLVAADLYAASFSDSSISAKTKKMQASVSTLREIVVGMQTVAKQALGEDTGGGLFGFGAKKLSNSEAQKQMKELYVKGGNAWNEYVQAANDELALQFNRFPYIG